MHKHIFLTYSSIAMWLTVLHLTLVHSHVLNIGEKAQPDLDQSKPSLSCTNENIGQKVQLNLHQSEHRREPPA